MTSKFCILFTVRYRSKIRTNQKKALACTWACEHFADFIIGTEFTIVTNHKPLITLLSSAKNLYDLPPRIQRFRIRLMRFHYKIVFVHGSDIGAANVLLRLPLPVVPSNDEASPIVEQHIDYILSFTPIIDTSMTQLKEATRAVASFKYDLEQ